MFAILLRSHLTLLFLTKNTTLEARKPVRLIPLHVSLMGELNLVYICVRA